MTVITHGPTFSLCWLFDVNMHVFTSIKQHGTSFRHESWSSCLDEMMLLFYFCVFTTNKPHISSLWRRTILVFSTRSKHSHLYWGITNDILFMLIRVFFLDSRCIWCKVLWLWLGSPGRAPLPQPPPGWAPPWKLQHLGLEGLSVEKKKKKRLVRHFYLCPR